MGVLVLLEARVAAGLELEVSKLELRGKLLASGETHLGGRVPVNPSGGLLARGHPIGATGCAQLVELADQLRGRAGDRQVGAPRIAVAQNAGGSLGLDEASAVVTVLSAP